MLSTMLHEPVYNSGTLSLDKAGVAAGWVAHRGSYADGMPVWNENRDICLLFAGENFMDRADLQRLSERGHKFDVATASSLVHLYEEAEDRFFMQLNGTFSGLLVDLRRQQVVLFNDRYGLGRLYYHEAKEGLYFASEAKALLKVLPHLRQVSIRSLGEYFGCGAVLQDRTLFEQISLLPPGSAWIFRGGRPAIKTTYFDRAVWLKQTPLPEQDYYAALKATFSRVLPRYFANHEHFAMSLTGGLDSRLIMAWANGDSSKLTCYSHVGMFNQCADAHIGARVAEICGCPHRLIQVGNAFCSEFPKLAERTVYLTDGVMDVNGAAGLYANRLAREIAPLRITGNYGGEVLRGVVMLGPSKLRNPYFSDGFSRIVGQAIETLASEKKVPRTEFITFKQVPWHHYSRFALESSQWTIRSPYLDNELVALAFRAPQDTRTNQILAERLISDGNAALTRFPTDRGPLGRRGLLGRMGETYQEITFKADYAFDYGMPQWLTNVDRMLSPLHLERLFLGRHKYYHFRFWYRNQLAPFVRDVLLDRRALARPYLDGERVKTMVEAHVTGRGNYTSEITNLLTAELMYRQLIEGAC